MQNSAMRCSAYPEKRAKVRRWQITRSKNQLEKVTLPPDSCAMLVSGRHSLARGGRLTIPRRWGRAA